MTSPKVVVPMSRDKLLDWIGHAMRNRAFPEFHQAPLPLWATDAAENVLGFIESIGNVSAVDPDKLPTLDALEAALTLLAENNIHGGLPNGYCAVCEGGCMVRLGDRE